jgi:hypothetical protein
LLSFKAIKLQPKQHQSCLSPRSIGRASQSLSFIPLHDTIRAPEKSTILTALSNGIPAADARCQLPEFVLFQSQKFALVSDGTECGSYLLRFSEFSYNTLTGFYLWNLNRVYELLLDTEFERPHTFTSLLNNIMSQLFQSMSVETTIGAVLLPFAVVGIKMAYDSSHSLPLPPGPPGQLFVGTTFVPAEYVYI